MARKASWARCSLNERKERSLWASGYRLPAYIAARTLRPGDKCRKTASLSLSVPRDNFLCVYISQTVDLTDRRRCAGDRNKVSTGSARNSCARRRSLYFSLLFLCALSFGSLFSTSLLFSRYCKLRYESAFCLYIIRLSDLETVE